MHIAPKVNFQAARDADCNDILNSIGDVLPTLFVMRRQCQCVFCKIAFACV